MMLGTEENIVNRLILVIEHDSTHAALIEQVLGSTPPQRQIIALGHGKAAIDFLKRKGNYTDAPRPDLILLNLDLPDIAGIELLSQIKADPQLRRIPIVVLTLSNRAEDIFKAYTFQSNCYVIKSADLAQLAQIIKRIEEFWLGIVTLPTE